jgi:hypothetical protein
MNAMYTVLMPTKPRDQILAICREYAARAHRLGEWKPMLRTPVLCKAWE